MEMIDNTTSVISQDSLAVRIVDHGDCAMSLGYFDDVGQRSDVPVHAEDAVGDDHLRTRLVLVFLDLLFQTGNVAVFEGHDLRLAETATVDDTGICLLYTSPSPRD